MFQRATSRSARATKLRSRAAVLAAGLGVSVAMGVGVGFAAGTAMVPAVAKSAVTWVDPVKNYALVAGFGQAGTHWTHQHGSTVVKVGHKGGTDGPAYGDVVVIKRGNGTYSPYAHLSRADVKAAQVVGTGQHTARAGNTGNTGNNTGV
jgi:hypothetical protein